MGKRGVISNQPPTFLIPYYNCEKPIAEYNTS